MNHEQQSNNDQMIEIKTNRFKKTKPDKSTKYFSNLKDLNHIDVQDNFVIFECDRCPYTTKRKCDLRKHVQKHCSLDTATVYKCSMCSYETKRKNDMPKHMLAHCTNVERYKCPECPYETKRKCDMPKHLLCHKSSESVPMYKCEYCHYVTKRKGDLPKHTLKHQVQSEIKFFECSECDHITARKNDLNKHMLVHCDRHITGVFKCIKCTYATDKMHKFSKHVLSSCKSWEACISIEYLMLDDILAIADQDCGHVALEKDSINEYGELEEEQEKIRTDCDGKAQVFYFSDSFEQIDDIHPQSVVQEIREDMQDVPLLELNEKHDVGNINLGEFTIEVDDNES